MERASNKLSGNDMYDFANILFSGPCSARCYFCIGSQINPDLRRPNLTQYPPAGIEQLMALIWEANIRQVVFSGTDTDPQLYRHEEQLLAFLRRNLPPGVQFSLHTNGRQALRKMSVFNQYDRVTISLPSFDPQVYFQMMGVHNPPDLARILAQAEAPVKISCLVDEHNAPGLLDFLTHCHDLGIRRLVLRKLFGDTHPMQSRLEIVMPALTPRASYRGNPVYQFGAMEVTVWDFLETQSRAINLFADGTLSDQYLLTSPGWAGEADYLHKTLSNWTASAPASSMA